MCVIPTSRLRVERHEGPHRTACLEGSAGPTPFGVQGGVRHVSSQK